MKKIPMTTISEKLEEMNKTMKDGRFISTRKLGIYADLFHKHILELKK